MRDHGDDRDSRRSSDARGRARSAHHRAGPRSRRSPSDATRRPPSPRAIAGPSSRVPTRSLAPRPGTAREVRRERVAGEGSGSGPGIDADRVALDERSPARAVDARLARPDRSPVTRAGARCPADSCAPRPPSERRRVDPAAHREVGDPARLAHDRELLAGAQARARPGGDLDSAAVARTTSRPSTSIAGAPSGLRRRGSRRSQLRHERAAGRERLRACGRAARGPGR